MAIPSLPAQGAPWLTYAQGLDAEARTIVGKQDRATLGADVAADGVVRATFGPLQKVASSVTVDGAAVVNQHNPVDATAAARTLTLPTGQPEGTTISIEKTDATGNTVTVSGSIRSSAGQALVLSWQFETLTLRADAAGSWWPVAGHRTKSSLDAVYGGYVNVKSFRAKVDGVTNDAAAVVAAIASLGSRGGTVFFPPGITAIGSTITVPSNVRLVGAGKNASIILKTFNGLLLDFSGTDTATRCSRSGMADIQLSGNTTNTGALVRAQYADHLNFARVWFNTNTGSGFVGIELWDTYFEGCEWDNMRGGDGLNPAVLLQSSATDSTNEVYFSHCRWEAFRDSALTIATGGLSSAWSAATGPHPVYGVYLTDCKMESKFLNGNVINFSSDVLDVHVDRLYLAADSLDTGASTPVDLINFKALAHITFSKLHVYIAANSTRSVFRMFPGPVGHAIRDVYVEAQTAPTVGIIDFAGGNPAMRIGNVRYRSGSATIYSGAVPTGVVLDDLVSAQPYGFPYTVEPGELRTSDVIALPGANQAAYLRVRDGGYISKVALQVGTASGNISVAVYRNSGVGRAAVPGTQLATSGAVACPAAGYAEIPLGSSVLVSPGDWLAISADNVTVTFRGAISGVLDSSLGLGRQFRAPTAHPLPSTPAGLVACIGVNILLMGV